MPGHRPAGKPPPDPTWVLAIKVLTAAWPLDLRSRPPSPRHRRAYGQVKHLRYWLDQHDVFHVVATRRNDTMPACTRLP